VIEPVAETTEEVSVATVEADPDIWSRLRRGFRLGVPRHTRVEREINRLRHSPNAFRALMARSEPYLYHILNELEATGLPAELALLPAVESGFRPHVYSADGAAGLWQFMPATGRMLGLDQDWWFDQRRTVRASTTAAIVYLNRLNERFSGDWLLTLAAYNAGAATVSRAIRTADRRGEPGDYWSLDLPSETDHYVPRLLALVAVVADPESYGLDLPAVLDRPYFAIADTGGQIDLNVAADLAGIEVEELFALNAGHKRWASRPDGPHELLLPIDKVAHFEQVVGDLPEDRRLRWRHHRIRRGDTLSRIARDYGVGIAAIRETNGLHDARILAGEDLIIPLSDSLTLGEADSKRFSRQRLHYRVRKGDSLYAIARRFQVSINDLKRWNRVGRYIRPGERLTLFVDPDA
jgi:membrane-bound lytic murein transglycosylase D